MFQNVFLPEGGASAFALTAAAVQAVTADDPVLVAMPLGSRIPQGTLELAAAAANRGVIAVVAARAASPQPGRACLRAPRGYVDAFVAEPDAATARACFEAGYLWSAGIFAVRASVWIEAVGCLRPELLRACGRGDPAGVAPESIERAVMEGFSEAGLEAAVVLLDDALREAA
jgi:mannose-1-phosphate guanylyltransferase / mannose-6-phosphate isomerase